MKEKRKLSKNIKIYWNLKTKEDLTNISDANIIAKTLDIKIVLNYKISVLQVITKIIIVYMINSIKSFFISPNNKENRKVCDETLIKLDNFKQLFKNANQPSYLIKNMSIFSADLWIQCFYTEYLEENEC